MNKAKIVGGPWDGDIRTKWHVAVGDKHFYVSYSMFGGEIAAFPANAQGEPTSKREVVADRGRNIQGILDWLTEEYGK